MAYDRDPIGEERRKQEQDALGVGGIGAAAGGAAPVQRVGGGGGGGSVAAGGPAAAPASGGAPSRFVNFDRYFAANAGAANQMAQGVQQKVTDAYGKAQVALTNQKSPAPAAAPGFGQQQTAFTPATVATGGATGLPRAGESAGKTSTGSGVSTGTALQSSPAAAPYSQPPPAFAPNADTAGLIATASDMANATLTPEGLQTFTTDYAKQAPGYSAGMGRFDAALLGRAGAEMFPALAAKYGKGDAASVAAGTVPGYGRAPTSGLVGTLLPTPYQIPTGFPPEEDAPDDDKEPRGPKKPVAQDRFPRFRARGY